DMDYDTNMFLTDTTINNISKLNLYNADLSIKNSKIHNMNLIANAYSDIKAENSTITHSSFSMDESTLKIVQSNLDSIKSMSNQSKISLEKATLMNKNKFHLYSKGKFTGKAVTVDGLDLHTEDGIVRYFDKNDGNSYQNKVDST